MTSSSAAVCLRLAGLLLAVCVASSCADKDRATTTERSTETTTLETTTTVGAPTELRRLGSSGTGRGSGQPESAIYRGTGTFVAPTANTGNGVKTGTDGEVALDFFNADIHDVAKSVLGDLLGLNYLVDSSVQGTVTVQTNQKLRREDVLPAFETVLRANGLALTQQGSFYSVVPFGSASKSVNVGGGDTGYGTEIVTLHYIGPDQMRRVLDPIVPQGAIVQADQSRNLLVIGGSESERAALRDRIATFDVDWLRGMSFALFTPRYATAKQLASDLTHVMGDENSPMAGQVRLVAIDRMNAVLAITAQSRYLDELKTWVARLDRGNETTDRRIFIYHVQNGRANDLANVVGRALGIRTNASQSSQSGQGAGSNRSTTGGSNGMQSSFSSDSSTQSPFSAGGMGSSARQGIVGSTGASRMQGGGDPEGLPEPSNPSAAPGGEDKAGGLSITADEVTNALLVVATPAEYDIIESALKNLDVLPLQVLIEAAIAEVTLTKDLNFGVQWKFNNGTNQASLTGTASNLIGPTNPGLNYLYTSGTRISAVLSALQDITKVDVLSAPKLMVLNNQTATLQVGDQVPIATQSSVSTLTPDAPTVNSIDYKDTGVLLTVTPRVNEGGLVLMDISQEVSDVATTTSSQLNSPTINQRKIGTTVAVQDGQTIALGGLIKDSRSTGQGGVPYLQDIPVLGHLFSQDTSNTERTELLVLITPRVVRDSRAAAAITSELRDKLMDLKDEFVPLRPRLPLPADRH